MHPESSRRLRLSRLTRFKSSRDFARPRAEGQRLACGCLIFNWLQLPPEAKSRVGLITGRKIGGAVVRSRARRLMRESFRLHQHDFERPVDLVLVGRPSIAGKKFSEVERDFLEAMRRSKLLKTNK